jgi:hypothetical protein
MKLVDGEETILIVIAAELEPEHPDRRNAEDLKREVDKRGAGQPYRRAIVVGDAAWFDTPAFMQSPTIAVGGPGVNGVTGRFAAEIPTVWTEGERVVIQAELDGNRRRAALWGMDRVATAEAVQTFVSRGWLDEFLERCWRFRMSTMA